MEAAETFRQVSERFPFSGFAILAELGLAQAQAGQGESEAALAGFTRFLKQHPGHPKTADVRFSIITTNWAERPGNFFLLPPAFERDLEDVRATQIACDAFLRFHRGDSRIEEVARMRKEARALLYRQAVFLARWTAQQGQPHGALARWDAARLTYPELTANAEDSVWAKQLSARLDGKALTYPDEPKLYPSASVLAPERQR